MPTEAPYCGVALPTYGEYYRDNIHGYVSIIVCFIGAIFNLLNLLVFTRRTMISPPNLIFTHLAIVDFLVLLARIPFVWLIYIQDKRDLSCKERTYGGTVFLVFCDTFVVTFQFISIFLTVMLATWRYIAVIHPLKERRWCNMKITRWVVYAGYVMCWISLGVAMSFSREIRTINVNQTTTYLFDYKRGDIMFSIAFFIYGPVCRLLPSVVLAVITFRLVVTLLARKTCQSRLTSILSVQNDIRYVNKMRQQTNTSTAILLIVVVLFFIAEFPKGILSLLRVIYERDERSQKIHTRCYASLIQIFTTLSDVNLSITFIVYYTLSQQFRITFKSLFNIKTLSFCKNIPLLALNNIEEIHTIPCPSSNVLNIISIQSE